MVSQQECSLREMYDTEQNPSIWFLYFVCKTQIFTLLCVTNKLGYKCERKTWGTKNGRTGIKYNKRVLADVWDILDYVD